MKVIFDKDGTLANNEQRMHLLPTREEANRTEGWTKFNQACVQDTLIREVANIYHALAPIYDTYVVTGACEDSKHETIMWLTNWSLTAHDELIMRPVGDHRKAADFKRDVFKRIGLEAGDLVVDDDPHVIEMVVREFPGVNVLRVDSRCAAVQNGISAQGSLVGTKADLIITDDEGE